ncbi:LIM/homeobox protein Lhx2 isoform X2 [Acyrthosiphon pisum]|uniref:LIM zinc-binding domain-containing protein n=1 Tax=Acyrthosiphon pisum TaxID=7029 RepID=A0A8R2F958_ACYPI|nr:LIM/homeobox protein Lhx2 isoform X2 [Acyrthosiphon pisum]|eukprot:XP_008183636.1 PREDICTED: LIM/homeobox protein Lhx2 isoform X2 [Acyrthosiphon pisum]
MDVRSRNAVVNCPTGTTMLNIVENDHQQTNGGVVTNGGTVTATTLTGLNGSTAMIARECANCGKRITERFLLKALDLFWHEDCLKCGCCDCRLGEVGSTLYTKANLILCKRDYLRLFGATGNCAACNKVIPAFEMVMRAKNNVYHLECFACQQCNHRFCVGDRFYLCENKILCEYDYEERLVFANMATYNSSSLAHIRRQVSRLQPAANEHAHAAAATAGDVVGPTDEVDRCRATSVEQQQQQQQQRRPLPPYDTATIGYSGATASPASGQQQQHLHQQQQQQQHQQHHGQQHQHMQQHHQFLSTAAGATVLSAHQSTVVVGGGGGAGGGGGGGGGGRVDDGSSGYGSPDSETGIEPSTAAAAAAAAAANIGGAIIASSATAAPPVQ